MAVRAVIYVAADGEREVTKWQRRCADWCAARGYEVVAVVRDSPDNTRWADAQAPLRDGWAQVLVVAERAQLPRRAVPRWEVVAEERRRPAAE